MAEETINQPNPPVSPAGSDEKQTNRTFTQSEFDSAIARETKKLQEQFKDYETLKKQAEELSKEKKERELAEKSEVEKLTIKLQEQTDKLTAIETERNQLKVLGLKNDVLARSEFASLPRAYRSLVSGDTEDTILKSAQDILGEYEADAKKINPQVSFRPPVGGQAPSKVANKTLGDTIKDALANRAARYGVSPAK